MSMTLPRLLGQVFCEHHLRLRNLAQRIVGDVHSAEDLVQEAYLKALESATQAEVTQPLPFACRVVRNLAIDQYRRGALEARLFKSEEDGQQVAAPAACTPESLTAGRQALTRIDRVLATLPDRARRVFELHRLEGRTQREIGTLLGISAATVNTLIQDTLLRCRAALQAG